MKLPVLALSALMLLPAHSAAAQRHGTRIEISDDDHDASPARPGPRHDLRDARYAITTTNDVASLLLTRRVVALQLTERALGRIGREMDDEDDADDGGFIGRFVASVVKSSVRTVLRRSLEIPIDDVRSVDYRNGTLVITTEDDDRVFDQVEVDDTDVMESFSRRDAEEFVRQFRALKAKSR
ncbi:hypothetical protein SAMN05216486_10140 [bacterium JGI 053]|nr:hypothetical protein SAMN05216486_10140 [bacterium JGI 053]